MKNSLWWTVSDGIGWIVVSVDGAGLEESEISSELRYERTFRVKKRRLPVSGRRRACDTAD